MIVEEGGRVAAIDRSLNDATYDPNCWIFESWTSTSERGTPTVSASVEMLRRRGGNPQRAVLGATYTPDASGLLTLRVGVTKETSSSDRPYIGQISHDLLCGLPHELTGGIVDAFRRAGSFGAGVVLINRAAYHLVDSSIASLANAAELLGVALDGRIDVEELGEAVLERMRSWD
jgi:hypothetical protein